MLNICCDVCWYVICSLNTKLAIQESFGWKKKKKRLFHWLPFNLGRGKNSDYRNFPKETYGTCTCTSVTHCQFLSSSFASDLDYHFVLTWAYHFLGYVCYLKLYLQWFENLTQVQHLQKVLVKKRDPVTHVCFIEELAKVMCVCHT